MARQHRITALLLGSLTIAAVSAQTPSLTLDQARTKLTGGSSKEWVLVRVESFMGGGAQRKCRQGETYTFHAKGTVTHKRCVDGQWQENTEPWSLSDLDELDRELAIGQQRFLLLLRDTAAEEQARLRTRSRDKVIPSVDQILRYERD